MLLRRLIIAVSVLSMPLPVHAATEDSQAWLTEMVTIKAGPADIITIDSSQRARSDSRSGGEQFLSRIAIDHRIAPAVQLGGGFAYLKSEADEELRLFQQVTLTKGIWMARTRMEQRFFDTVDAQLLYMRQQNFRDGRPDVVSHVPWLTLRWRI